MSYLTSENDFDFTETTAASLAVPECVNCHSTSNLVEIWPDDESHEILLCEECAAETRLLEAKACELVAKGGCEARQAIVDSSASTGQLVNRLTYHDMACMACRPVLQESGCTHEEAEAWIDLTAPRKRIERMQGELFTEVA